MLDSGHGFNTPGKRSLDGSLHEWSFNSIVAKYVADLLSQYENVTTYFAHDVTGATDVPLQTRTDKANQLGVDAYISFHANAGAVTARGLETYIYPTCPPKTVALGMAIHKSLIPTTGMTDRGLKRADFHVLRETKMDAVLIEHGFMTNDQDLRLLKDDAFRHKCAEGTVNALVSFYGLKKKVIATIQSVKPSVVYEAHVQDIGWQGIKRDGETAGTTGQSLRLEALTVKLENSSARLEMEGHIENLGWTSLRTNGEVIGTIGEGLRLEAVKIKADGLNVAYRVHVQNIGWTSWAKNGEVAGTTGQGLRIEAIEIKLA